MSVTHVAGPYVGVRGRGIQRCLWCGEKLVDTKGQAAPVPPGGEPPEALFFPLLGLVRVEGENPTRSSVVGEFDNECTPLPDDFCFDLVE